MILVIVAVTQKKYFCYEFPFACILLQVCIVCWCLNLVIIFWKILDRTVPPVLFHFSSQSFCVEENYIASFRTAVSSCEYSRSIRKVIGLFASFCNLTYHQFLSIFCKTWKFYLTKVAKWSVSMKWVCFHAPSVNRNSR